jgi:hypothetical protein
MTGFNSSIVVSTSNFSPNLLNISIASFLDSLYPGDFKFLAIASLLAVLSFSTILLPLQ